MRKYEYVEIEDNAPIHPGLAIAQGIQLLDLASAMATDNKDIDKMTSISLQWIDTGVRLTEIMEEIEDEKEPPEKEKITLGFGMPPNSVGKIDDEETDDDED